MRALEMVDDWPVDTVAVGVAGPDGVLARRGPTDRSFPLASVTKVLAALAVHLAVEEGAISLDDPAGLPDATVAHLLAHASGMAPDERSRAADVGTRRIYSNAGFEALGEHVEQATGIGFADYLHQGIGEPLGLSATRLDGSPARAAQSTVDDLLRVGQELLRPTLLHEQSVARIREVAFPGLDGVLPGFGRQEPNDWGLGVEVRGSKSPHWTGGAVSPRAFGHFGQSGTFLLVDPVAGVVLVCLTDRDFGGWAAHAWPALTDAVVQEAGG